MADPTPLILPADELLSSETLSKNQYPKNQSLSPNSTLDEIIEKYIGDFGWAQLLQAVLISLAWLFDAQQTFISVFTDAVPPNWDCTTGTKPDHASIVSEWGLPCSDSVITGLPRSSFFMGCLVAGFLLATVADSSLGRKNMLLLSTLLMSLSGIFTAAFSTNVWAYSAFRFMSGLGRANIGVCSLVLSTELVGRQWRDQVGIIGFFCYTLGFLSLPLIAYPTRGSSWRVLYYWTSGPAVFYCVLLHLFVKESPRWLFVRGRKQEFVNTLKSIAPRCCSVTEDVNLLCTTSIGKEENVGFYSTMKILLGKRWAMWRLSAVMVVGFGTGMVYYGMPLGLGNLAYDNIYMSVMLNALSELPASLATFCAIGRLNRKSLMLVFTTLSGVCSIFCVAVRGERLQIGMELVSFFSACTAFNVLMIFTLELFPTCIRNSAISMVRQALVLGGAFSPVLMASGRKNVFLSYGVFGLSIGFCGLFVMLVPETKGGTLCDTTDEEENKIKQVVTANSTCV